MTSTTPQLSDDDRRAQALSAVICNDTTLLSEWNGGEPDNVAQRRTTVASALRRDAAREIRDLGHWLKQSLFRVGRAVDTTQL